jgi:hypothetical protein
LHERTDLAKQIVVRLARVFPDRALAVGKAVGGKYRAPTIFPNSPKVHEIMATRDGTV